MLLFGYFIKFLYKTVLPASRMCLGTQQLLFWIINRNYEGTIFPHKVQVNKTKKGESSNVKFRGASVFYKSNPKMLEWISFNTAVSDPCFMLMLDYWRATFLAALETTIVWSRIKNRLKKLPKVMNVVGNSYLDYLILCWLSEIKGLLDLDPWVQWLRVKFEVV